ncbi:MAG: hypothetical protein PWQ57_2445 [Desulfovibrionales bacterium]|nr:hypothetical protein [Desulfovibrionales bacterium]
MPHKFKRNGAWTKQWYGQVKVNGKRFRGPLMATRAEAVEWEAEKRRRLATMPEQEIVAKTATVSLIEWANKYLDYAFRYQPKTYSEKKRVLARAVKALGKNTPVTAISPGVALDYLQGQYKKRSGHAANKERKNLVAAWHWGAKYMDGFPDVNPFKAVEKFPHDKQERYVPPEEDFWAVVDKAKGQDRVMLLTMLHTAARKGEVFRLQWSDVDFSRQRIRLTTRKRMGGSMEADWIPMTDDLFNVLLEHRRSAVNEWVFVQSVGRHNGKPYKENRGFPQELCEEAKVKPFGCHAIRHLTASILARAGVPIVVIQGLLRHRKLSTTEGYIHGPEHLRPHLAVLEGGAKVGSKGVVRMGCKNEGSNSGSNKRKTGSGGTIS